MTPPKRWYQLSMLQMLVAMAVMAVFVGLNVKAKFVQLTYAMRSHEVGWPFTFMVRYSRPGTQWFEELGRSDIHDSSARSYHTSIVEWRRLGYRVILYFIWLRSFEMAIERVAGRVQQGGHYIPEDVVRRRYERGMRNLFELYAPIVSNVYVFDGTAFPPILVAEIEGENSRVLDYTRWEVIVRQRTDASHD